MNIPFEDRLSLPAVAAPMFLISGPQLVIECCKNGIVGTFPALNQRTTEGFEEWVIEIKEALSTFEKETGKNTFEHFQSAVEGQKKNKKFREKFTNLVENKFEFTRKKLKLN